MKAVLESKEYINSLLFNHNGYIKKFITTKAIINKKLFFLIYAEFDIKTRSELVYYCTTHGIVKHPNYYDNTAKTSLELK